MYSVNTGQTKSRSHDLVAADIINKIVETKINPQINRTCKEKLSTENHRDLDDL